MPEVVTVVLAIAIVACRITGMALVNLLYGNLFRVLGIKMFAEEPNCRLARTLAGIVMVSLLIIFLIGGAFLLQEAYDNSFGT